MTTDERNLLIVNYLPLAHKLAWDRHRKTPKYIQIDELCSAAYLGLVDAASKYDSSRLNSFASYAYLRISGEISDYLREIQWGARGRGFHPISLDTHFKDRTIDIEYYDNSEIDTKEFFEKATEQLNRVEKKVVFMYYVENKSHKEIGEKLGCGKSWICQLLKKSRDKIKIHLEFCHDETSEYRAQRHFV